MPQRRLSKRHQGQVHTRRVMAGRRRKVRASEMRRRTDRREQVVHQPEMQHLLRRNVRDHAAPARDRLELGIAQALVSALLEREGGKQVLAHDPVLELGGLTEHVNQGLAMLDHERGLRRRQPTPRRDHLRQPTPTSTTRAHGGSLLRIPIDGKGKAWGPLRRRHRCDPRRLTLRARDAGVVRRSARSRTWRPPRRRTASSCPAARTSRNSPSTTPIGVRKRYLPPGRTSISSTTVPSPHHSGISCGSVQTEKTCARGASKTRSTRISSSVGAVTAVSFIFSSPPA